MASQRPAYARVFACSESPPTYKVLTMVGCGDVGGWSVFRKWFDCQSSCGPWPVNMNTDTEKCKYKLRQNKKMDSDEGNVSSGPKKRGPKPRLRSAGMSRYRRKEANARERQRQGEINTSFDKLREKIPHPGPTNGKCEKLRKIDILHVAINYIRYAPLLNVTLPTNTLHIFLAELLKTS